MALDVQMKKGLLEICVLKALSDGESYGYKIIKDVSAYIDISESTLYPILKRLESDGHLVCTTAALFPEQYDFYVRGCKCKAALVP